MRLTKFSHSCVRLVRDDAVLVIDPGGFSERASLDGVDAVLITHEHADHLDVDKLADALDKRPLAQVYAHSEVAAKLGALNGVVQTVNAGDRFQAAGFDVQVYGGWHAVIHQDVPVVPNLGFLVEGSVYHPGDSFDVPPDVEIDTLFVPISAPWLKVSEAIDFVRAVAPRRAYALHDSLANDNGLGLLDRLMGQFSGADYSRLVPGETVDA
ncbi:MBL fold metallo-hydrolase [Rugosimonospora africana]|uniref:MBL fold metallo-hydrolase n=1 Tax=Rugosimonospora africana TaxID=556532 RepID=A0A8J3QMV9_9ACTN|nr:MBL fold metallo-hydrolase [Rugosimonospora africana]GIH12635.1 MBL fold metallo-hydrolase [Rugosimonospora africana]